MKYTIQKIMMIVISVSLLLVACQPVAPATENVNPSAQEKTTQASNTSEEEGKPASAESNSNPTAVVGIGQPTAAQSSKQSCRVTKSPFPPVTDSDWSIGPKDAKVTLMIYDDFQCPYCALFEPIGEKLIKAHPHDLRFVFRNFPLIGIHDKAALAAQAADAAGTQGKFWEMYRLLYENQQEWTGMELDKFQEWLLSKVGEIGLDKDKFAAEYTSDQTALKAQKYYDDAVNLGLPGTPTIAINGVFFNGEPSFEGITSYINNLDNLKTYDKCPDMTIDTKKKYFATLHMDKGDIKIELFADKAPITVNSFVFLAREGYFDGVTFHRVISGFVAQTGDRSGTGSGGPGYEFVNEISPDLTFGKEGMVGMANSGADTNGSQFFITYAGITKDVVKRLDGNYTIFGKVVSGMDVVKGITARDPSQNPNLPPGDVIKSVTIEEQ